MLHTIISTEAKKRGWDNYSVRDFEANVTASNPTQPINAPVDGFCVAYSLMVKCLTDDLLLSITAIPTADSNPSANKTQLAVLAGNAYTVYNCQFVPEYSTKMGVYLSPRHTVFDTANLEYRQGYYTLLRYLIVTKS